MEIVERKIRSLNNLMFLLPSGYVKSDDKYNLGNGQGFINCENYFGENGVISLFEIHRDPDEFFEYYHSMMENTSEEKDEFFMFGYYSLKANNFVIPLYAIKSKSKGFFTIQAFVNCANSVACFMITSDKWDKDLKVNLSSHKLFGDLVKILRTVQ